MQHEEHMTDPGEIRRSIGRSHALPPETVLKTLGVYPERGLDDEEAAKMRKLYGANLLPEPVAKSKLLLFLEQFNNPLIFVLFGAAVLTTIVSDVSEAITIFFVVVFNAIIGYLQEQRAGERLKAVKSLTAPHARLLRAGEDRYRNAGDLLDGSDELGAVGSLTGRRGGEHMDRGDIHLVGERTKAAERGQRRGDRARIEPPARGEATAEAA